MYVYARKYACMYVCIYVCMYVREGMYASMYVCKYVCFVITLLTDNTQRGSTLFPNSRPDSPHTFALSVRQFLNVAREENFGLVLKLNMH